MCNPNVVQYPQKGADIVTEPIEVNEIEYDGVVYVSISRAGEIARLSRMQIYSLIGKSWQAITIDGKTFVRLEDAKSHVKKTHK